MSSDSMDWVDQEIASGRYRIIAKLGEGGMGFVYRALDKNIDTEVVIKVPRREMLADPEFKERFSREIRSLVKLQHPNVVTITDVGEHEGVPFAVMQFLDAGDLESWQVPGADGSIQPVSADRITGWLPGVASALDFIHSQGFIHRDVKPANILFDASGNAFLSDFGVAKLVSENTEASAKLTGTGMVLGTAAYMSPELIMDEACDGRVDQYALAVTVYELLAGRVPFQASNPGAVLVLHTREEPPEITEFCPELPVAINDAVMRGLAKNPDDRYATCREFSDSVVTAIATELGTGELLTVLPGAPPSSEKTTAKNFATKAISIAQNLVSGKQKKVSSRRRKVSAWKNPALYRALLVGLLAVVVFGLLGLAVAGLAAGYGVLVEWVSDLSVTTLSIVAVGATLIWGFVTRQLYTSAVRPGKAGTPGFLQSKLGRLLTNGCVASTIIAAAIGLFRVSDGLVSESQASVDLTDEETVQAIPEVTPDTSGNYRNCVGMDMICLLPGRFRDRQNSAKWQEFSKPGNPIWVSRTEVTVAQYLAFVLHELDDDTSLEASNRLPEWLSVDGGRAEAYQKFSNNHKLNGVPIVGVTREQANRYCRWLTQTEPNGFSYRLGSDDEWTCAYRGGAEGRYYWGNDFVASHCNGGDPHTASAPKLCASGAGHRWGLADMAGNAWEFTQESARGGSFKCGPDQCTVDAMSDATVGEDLGFRVFAERTGS